MDKTFRLFMTFILAMLICIIPATGYAAGQGSVRPNEIVLTEEKDVVTDATDVKTAEKESKEEEISAYDAAIKDKKTIEGLFTFYRDEKTGVTLMKIMPDQLDVIYLISPTMESGVGDDMLLGGMMWGEAPVKFHKEPGMVQVIKINTMFRADDPQRQGVLDKMYSSSILANPAIAAEDEKSGAILVDLSSIFVSDFLGLSPLINYWLDVPNSKISALKSFPENVNISVLLTFHNDNPPPNLLLPDSRSLQVGFRYDISKRPDTGYIPRIADSRVGYFVTTYQDFTDDTNPERFKYLAQRWDLKKKFPNQQMSPPEKPIVFWLENTVPVQYRQTLTDGILMWNKAFEKVGIEGAMEVKQMPDNADWDPADIRYNTIRWFSGYNQNFAIGPCRTDPFTGQIYDADIGVSIDMAHSTYTEFMLTVDILKKLDNSISKDSPSDPAHSCQYGEISSMMNAWAMDSLRARGMMEPGSPEEEAYVTSYLKELICHEVGHTLGLRHNYKGTRGIPTRKLQDKAFTALHGTTSSVMDYDMPNIAPPGIEQGDYFSPTVGDYDVWAIEWGYSILDGETAEENKPALNEIASQAASEFLGYGTDEDTDVGPFSMDPDAVTWDMGDDPFEYYEGSFKITQEIWDNLEEHWSAPGTDYKWWRATYLNAFWEYFRAGRVIQRYIGGIRHNRYHVGDPNAGPPYEPVSGDVQRKALRFMDKYLWAEDAFTFDPELLNKLGNSRFSGFDYSVFGTEHDFPLHKYVLQVQTQPLDWCYDPVVMRRLFDMEYKYPEGVEPFALADMFQTIRGSIWTEADEGRNVNSFRRDLQRYHLSILIWLLVSPPEGTPDDARALARMDLVHLEDVIGKALTTQALDYITRAHFEEIEARIKAALAAEYDY